MIPISVLREYMPKLKDEDLKELGPFEYDQSKVPEVSKKHAENVRRKAYLPDMTESFARGVEYAGLIASEAKEVSNEVWGKWSKVTAEWESDPSKDPEVTLSRGGFASVPKRLDDLSEKTRGQIFTIKNVADLIASTDFKSGDYIRMSGWRYENELENLMLFVKSEENLTSFEKLISIKMSNNLFAVPQIKSIYSDSTNQDFTVNQLMYISRTYFLNRDKFAYDVHRPRTVFSSTESTLSQIDGSTDKHSIVCSTFVELALKAIPFENSRYNGGTNNAMFDYNMDYIFKDNQDVANDPDANGLAKKFYNAGNLHQVNKDWSNIQRGDVLFFSKPKELSGASTNQFCNIFHNGIYAGKLDGKHTIYHSFGGGLAAVGFDIINKDPANVGSELTFFARPNLDRTKNYWVNQSIISKGANAVNAVCYLTIKSGAVYIDIKGVQLTSGFTGDAIVAKIANADYCPQETVYFVGTNVNAQPYRGTIDANGEIRIFRSTQFDNNMVYGTVSYPLRHVRV